MTDFGTPLPPTGAAHFAAMLKDLEERIRVLETAPRAPFTSVGAEDGQGLFSALNAAGQEIVGLSSEGFKMHDDNGQLRVVIGAIPDEFNIDGYGVLVVNEDASVGTLGVNEEGFWYPYFAVPFIPRVNDTTDTRFCTVTSGTFQAYYECLVPLISHPALRVRVRCTTDVGTEAEFRLLTSIGTTSTVPVGSGGDVTQDFSWLHGLDQGSGNVGVSVECRVTNGGGNAYIWLPYNLTLLRPDTSTVTGI